MFGSEIAGAYFARELALVPAVADTVKTRIFNLGAAPGGEVFPLALHYMETGTYSGVTSGDIDFESMRYVVRLICPGESTDPIKKAAYAQLRRFGALVGSIEYLDDEDELQSYSVETMASGEWPLTTLQDGTKIYRCLGTFYTVNVSRIGV